MFGNEINSLGWILKIDRENKRIKALNNNNLVTFWNFDKIITWHYYLKIETEIEVLRKEIKEDGKVKK